MTAILLSLSNLKRQVQLLSKHKWSYFEFFCIISDRQVCFHQKNMYDASLNKFLSQIKLKFNERKRYSLLQNIVSHNSPQLLQACE